MNEKTKGSRLPGFYNLSLQERQKIIQETGRLSDEEICMLSGEAGLSAEQADHMVENVIGTYALPLGLGLNFVVNGQEVLVPMAIEEPSVVAGASFMARLVRQGGGFLAHTTPPEMIGQMQVLDISDLASARLALLEASADLLTEAAELDPVLKSLAEGRAICRCASSRHPQLGPSWWCT